MLSLLINYPRSLCTTYTFTKIFNGYWLVAHRRSTVSLSAQVQCVTQRAQSSSFVALHHAPSGIFVLSKVGLLRT